MAFSRRHYRALSPPADTKADIAARLIDNKARELARAECQAAFPTITAENFDAACRFQEERISFHVAALTTGGTQP